MFPKIVRNAIQFETNKETIIIFSILLISIFSFKNLFIFCTLFTGNFLKI